MMDILTIAEAKQALGIDSDYPGFDNLILQALKAAVMRCEVYIGKPYADLPEDAADFKEAVKIVLKVIFDAHHNSTSPIMPKAAKELIYHYRTHLFI
jgi:hypothetical protein